MNRGIAYHRLGEFKKAIEFYQQALSIMKEVGNKDSEGDLYMNLGCAYRTLGDFKTAIKFQQQALSIMKEVGNKDSEGSVYTNLGTAYYSLGDFKTAIKLHQEALSIVEKVGNKDSEGSVYTNLGNGYRSLGDFKTAIKFHQQALSIMKEVGNKDSEGRVYTNLGNAYWSLGDFKTAIKFHQQALSIMKEVGNKDSEGSVYTNLGSIYRSLGDSNTAIKFHQQALSIKKEVGNKDSEGRIYMSLGNAYHSLGDFKTAIKFHQQALSIMKEVGNKNSEGRVYMSLGNAYHSLGYFKTAIKFHQQALTIMKEVGNKDSEEIAYGNLGCNYWSEGDYEKATKCYQRALNIAKEVWNKLSEGFLHRELGSVYFSLGNFKASLEFYQECLRIVKEVGSKAHEGSAYERIGTVYYRRRDFKTAIEYHRKALSIAKETGNKILEATANEFLGNDHFRNDVCTAEDFYKWSVRLFDELRGLLQSSDRWKIDFRNLYKACYINLWRVQLQQNKTMEALFTAERGRAQALMDLMESQYGVKSVHPMSAEKTSIISSIPSHLPSQTIFFAEASSSLNFWLLQKGLCHIERKEISDSMESLTHKTYKQIGVFKKVMCENRSLDGPADEESEEVANQNRDEKSKASAEGEGDALKALSEVVLGPISHLLQSDEVIIVPDGPLFLVPYAALLDQQSRYLSETLTIRLVPTLTSLKLMTECPDGYHSTSGARLVGDPWVEGIRYRGSRILQLPAAKEEVEMIGAILNIKPLTGKEATKAEVLSRLNSVALVHIAAHGRAETGEIFLSPNPTVAKKKLKQEDFLLTMADVLNAKLRARLVVLSCCHSGRGKIKAEGVVGLARAFLGAGARSVLASLWAISDEATLQFMRYFYEHLAEGQRASKALHQAMKQMRESGNFSDIKYWAPFVPIGDDVTLNFGHLR